MRTEHLSPPFLLTIYLKRFKVAVTNTKNVITSWEILRNSSKPESRWSQNVRETKSENTTAQNTEIRQLLLEAVSHIIKGQSQQTTGPKDIIRVVKIPYSD
jgi:hypothetical protein